MKDVEILGVGLRIIGIYCLIQIISMTSLGINYIRQLSPEFMVPDERWSLYLSVGLPIVLIFLVGVLLIKYPVIIAKKLIPRTIMDLDKLHFNENVLFISVTRIIGIYLVVFGLSDVVFYVLVLFQQSKLGVDTLFLANKNAINLVVKCIEIFIGLYLLLGAKGILKLIQKFRG